MQLKRPTLLLDREKCLANIHFMAEKASRHNVEFRPHFKTHQSAEIGRWFKDFGVSRITVSSVTMAEYFAGNGWNDITIAFPVNLAEVDEINALARKINLNVLVENPEAVEALAGILQSQVGVFIKVDAGYHRTGIDVERRDKILDLIHLIGNKRHLTFKGLIAHNGHTYHQTVQEEANTFTPFQYMEKTQEAILSVHNQCLTKLLKLKNILSEQGIHAVLSVGDTPALSLTENFAGIDEIRPGNFVFYDLMQQKLGVCSNDQIAVALACPIVAIHPERLEVVIYGGAVHLSKDFITGDSGNPVYGEVVWLNENGWSAPIKNTYVKSLSQEHGIIKTTQEFIHQFRPGMFVGILPIHSCLTNSYMPWMQTLNGQIIRTMDLYPEP